MIRFGIPAVIAAILGAWLLLHIPDSKLQFGMNKLPIGGALSGFFGGLSGYLGR